MAYVKKVTVKKKAGKKGDDKKKLPPWLMKGKK
jgi:hypothetical protein